MKGVTQKDNIKSILFFGCSIAHSRGIAITLNSLYGDKGVAAEHVSGETSTKRRNEIVSQFKEQKINILCLFENSLIHETYISVWYMKEII